MNRLTARLQELRGLDHKAMGIFLTCGFPSLDATLPLMQAIDRAGADFVELGMPFSDPLAEGKPIQHSSEVALANGVNLRTVLEAVAEFRATSQTPVVLMGYVNPIFAFGVDEFCAAAASVGVDGLILPDLPLEETIGVGTSAKQHNLSIIYLIAPNTPAARVRAVDDATTGFVYAVSFTGLTGAALDLAETVQEYLRAARQLVSRPLLVGFGIKTAEDAEKMTTHTDGFIVGSALITEVDRLWADEALGRDERLARVELFVRRLRPQRS